ncbi:MAG: glycosyltransferase, partial [Anaerolineae bacterium]
LVLIEAMMSRVPIVASRAGAIPEVLQHGRYGRLFDSGDVEGLIEQLRYVYAHPDEIAAVVEEAHRYALETFTVDAMVEQTIATYHRWLRDGEPSPEK